MKEHRNNQLVNRKKKLDNRKIQENTKTWGSYESLLKLGSHYNCSFAYNGNTWYRGCHNDIIQFRQKWGWINYLLHLGIAETKARECQKHVIHTISINCFMVSRVKGTKLATGTILWKPLKTWNQKILKRNRIVRNWFKKLDSFAAMGWTSKNSKFSTGQWRISPEIDDCRHSTDHKPYFSSPHL